MFQRARRDREFDRRLAIALGQQRMDQAGGEGVTAADAIDDHQFIKLAERMTGAIHQ